MKHAFAKRPPPQNSTVWSHFSNARVFPGEPFYSSGEGDIGSSWVIPFKIIEVRSSNLDDFQHSQVYSSFFFRNLSLSKDFQIFFPRMYFWRVIYQTSVSLALDVLIRDQWFFPMRTESIADPFRYYRLWIPSDWSQTVSDYLGVPKVCPDWERRKCISRDGQMHQMERRRELWTCIPQIPPNMHLLRGERSLLQHEMFHGSVKVKKNDRWLIFWGKQP